MSVTERRWERRIVVDAIVNHRIEAVFPYLSNPTQWHDFAPAVAFRKQIDAGPPGVGTRWMATDRIGPFRIHFIDRLESLDENRRVVWLSSAPWNSRVEYACAESGEGTRIRADYAGVLSDSLRWQVGWLPGWAMAPDPRPRLPAIGSAADAQGSRRRTLAVAASAVCARVRERLSDRDRLRAGRLDGDTVEGVGDELRGVLDRHPRVPQGDEGGRGGKAEDRTPHAIVA